MKYRIVMWAGAGFLVAGFWALFAIATFPSTSVASFRMGMSGSASFQSLRKCSWGVQSTSHFCRCRSFVSDEKEAFGAGIMFERGKVRATSGGFAGFHFDFTQREAGFEP